MQYTVNNIEYFFINFYKTWVSVKIYIKEINICQEMQYDIFILLVTEDYLCLYQFFEVHSSSFGLCFDGTKGHKTCEKLSLLALFRKTRLHFLLK